MKITVIAVGKARKGPETGLIAEYSKRLPWQLSFIEVEEKRPLSKTEKMASEGNKLLAAMPKGNFAIAMDRGGKTLSSEEFAKSIEKWSENHQGVTFLIGGADGLSQAVLSQADFKLSFGPMTWPHLLARTMLVEQLYRAYAIRKGHPYHK